jgi:hypothetical protein
MIVSLDEIRRLLVEQMLPGPGLREIQSLRVAPDVFAKLLADVPHVEGSARPQVCWPIVVDKWLPAGAIIPLDADGKPIERPATTHPRAK